MNLVVIVDEKGKRLTNFKEVIKLADAYDVCCKDTPDNKIVESAPERFRGHPQIDILIHEEGIIERLPVYCTINGEKFSGPLLICKLDGEGDWVGLTPDEVILVLDEVRILDNPVPDDEEPICEVYTIPEKTLHIPVPEKVVAVNEERGAELAWFYSLPEADQRLLVDWHQFSNTWDAGWLEVGPVRNTAFLSFLANKEGRWSVDNLESVVIGFADFIHAEDLAQLKKIYGV